MAINKDRRLTIFSLMGDTKSVVLTCDYTLSPEPSQQVHPLLNQIENGVSIWALVHHQTPVAGQARW